MGDITWGLSDKNAGGKEMAIRNGELRMRNLGSPSGADY